MNRQQMALSAWRQILVVALLFRQGAAASCGVNLDIYV